MAKILKHKQATVRLNNTTVIVYYSYKGKQMRYPTGVTIPNEKNKDGKFKYWDYTNNRLLVNHKISSALKHNIEMWESKQLRINELLNKANQHINDEFKKGIIISPVKLEKLMYDKKTHALVELVEEGFFDYFDKFVQRKLEYFKNHGSESSIKDYNTTYNLLKDFEVYQKFKIEVNDLDKLWLEDLVNYMSSKHPEYYGKYKLKSKGDMNDGVIKKRLSVLAEFYAYLKELKVVSHEKEEIIRNLKKRIKVLPTRKVTLDIDEIHQLYRYEFNDKGNEQIRDLFVFLCLTGIRFQDLVDFDKRFIHHRKKDDGFIYVKAASKTSLDYNIPLCKIVIEILNKYNYNLPKVSSQHGNREIKKIIAKTGLLNEYTQIKKKKSNDYKKRYEAITLHKGRNTFITNLVDSTPLNELMKYTGHKKLSTLQGYIDNKRPIKMDYIKIFDE
jgi:site-specific recombinase XerD